MKTPPRSVRFFAYLAGSTALSLFAAELPDFGRIAERSEYRNRPGVNSLLGRQTANRPGVTEVHIENPPGLDTRREALIDALWRDDEAAFLELAASPLTVKISLVRQNFGEVSRELARFRSEPFRTLREHPIDPAKDKDGTPVWCRHQWMTLPEDKGRTPVRGNLRLTFDPDDWSLRVVSFNRFKISVGINVLPDPDETIPNDPVLDRPAAGNKG